MLSKLSQNQSNQPASADDLKAFLNWLAGNDMPSVDTYGWLLRCEQWVKSHVEKDKTTELIARTKRLIGELNASERSNKGSI
tara:strand:+ start:719 stop:964 length:246 start_codon:yes stop_codon:yes gene_type:complete